MTGYAKCAYCGGRCWYYARTCTYCADLPPLDPSLDVPPYLVHTRPMVRRAHLREVTPPRNGKAA
jgi:hypothetical protein